MTQTNSQIREEIIKTISLRIDKIFNEDNTTRVIEKEQIFRDIDSLLKTQREEIMERIEERQKLFNFIPQDEYGYKRIKIVDLDIFNLIKEQ